MNLKQILSILFGAILLMNCKKEKSEIQEFQKFNIDKNIVSSALNYQLKKYGVNNTIFCSQSINFGLSKSVAWNRDYTCNAFIGEKDTLNIWLNNYNGSFGNGILLKVFENRFFVKSVNPNVIKGIKFEKFTLIKQELILNKNTFKNGDKISGYISFECHINSTKNKKMEGYFQSKIFEY